MRPASPALGGGRLASRMPAVAAAWGLPAGNGRSPAGSCLTLVRLAAGSRTGLLSCRCKRHRTWRAVHSMRVQCA